MVKMAKQGLSPDAIGNMNHLIKIPHAEVQEEKKRSVQSPACEEVKDAIE